jgi:hypothetical protein
MENRSHFWSLRPLSLELAILMIQNNTFVNVPFTKAQKHIKPIKGFSEAVGFGGNAVCVTSTIRLN